MGTEISRWLSPRISWTQPSSSRGQGRTAAALLALSAAATLLGCGGSASTAPSATTAATTSGFAWLRAAAAPAGWRSVRIPTGAVLAYPASWRTVAGDHGTATAVLRDAGGRYLAYLNLTPRQSRETVTTWPAFRVAHNREEDERDVVSDGAAHGLRFRDGRGTCVRDTYTTATGARFTEVACLVAGAHSGAVIVGAAPPRQWARQGPAIQRAIAAVALTSPSR
jgi:hypothetical protein